MVRTAHIIYSGKAIKVEGEVSRLSQIEKPGKFANDSEEFLRHSERHQQRLCGVKIARGR